MSDVSTTDELAKRLVERIRQNPLRRTRGARDFAELEDEIDRLHAENAALKSAVERVRALHTPIPSHVALIDVFGCSECSDDGRYSHYPCATLRALEVGRE